MKFSVTRRSTLCAAVAAVGLLLPALGARAATMTYAIDAILVDSTGAVVFDGQAGTFSFDIDLVDAAYFAPLESFDWAVPFAMDLSDVAADPANYAEAYVGGISPAGLFLSINDGANVLQLTTGNFDNSAGLIAWSCSSCPTYGTGFGLLGDVGQGDPFGSTYTTRLIDDGGMDDMEQAIPEPASATVFSLGFVFVAASVRRRRR